MQNNQESNVNLVLEELSFQGFVLKSGPESWMLLSELHNPKVVAGMNRGAWVSLAILGALGALDPVQILVRPLFF